MSSKRGTLQARYRGVGPVQELILESYVSAYPDVDVNALAANLAVATLWVSLQEGFEEKIRSLGFDLNRPRYTVLRSLYLTPGHTLPKAELAEAMQVTGAYVTQLLGSLEADGWVERIRDRTDTRAKHVRLTDAGIERCARLVPAMMRHMVETCNVLTKDELDQFISMLMKIIARGGPQHDHQGESVETLEAK